MAKILITLEQYAMGRDKLYPNEWTSEVQQNAKTLLEKVNALLNELSVSSAVVTSGFRPAAINNKITNAAKKSAHMIGKAVDILDNKNQDLAKLVANSPILLKKYGLWMESMTATKGKNTNWVHLDTMDRKDRPSRVFLP